MIGGFKVLHFNEFQSNYFHKYIDNNVSAQGLVGSFVFMVICGYNAIRKVRDIVGPPDYFMARKSRPNSVNATRYNKKDKTIIAPESRSSAKLYATFAFGGRLGIYD